MQSVAQLPVQPIGLRRFERRPVELSAAVVSPTIGNFRATIHNLSAGGLLLETRTECLLVGEWVSVEVTQNNRVRAKVVWRNGPFYGCDFEQEILSDPFSVTRLRVVHAGGAVAGMTVDRPNPPARRVKGGALLLSLAVFSLAFVAVANILWS